MERLQWIPFALAAALISSPAHAQEFWEYEPLEGETEQHQPTLGLETEYEGDGDIDVESEQYEYEPGEGYHEEEWYDPSDWFDFDVGVDYESEDWADDDILEDDYYEEEYSAGYGTYDDTELDYGYHYDSVTNDYEYGWHYDDVVDYDAFEYDYDYTADTPDVDYEFDQMATGTVVGLERFRPENGNPETVRLKFKTQDGQMKTIALGDLAYVNRRLPTIRKGDKVVVGGSVVNRNGRKLFKAEKLRTGENEYLVPEYAYRRRIEGDVVGLKRVAASEGNASRMIARVRTGDDKVMNVMLGTPKDMNEIRRNLKPGTKARVEGYRREVDGESTFVVQNIKVMNQPSNQSSQKSNRKSSS